MCVCISLLTLLHVLRRMSLSGDFAVQVLRRVYVCVCVCVCVCHSGDFAEECVCHSLATLLCES